jgi:NAD(P) transhydrogenase subunit alpha
VKIVALKETRPGETRVALVPETCKKLIKAGYTVAIESGAGEASFYPDAAFLEVGCGVENDFAALLGSADLVLKINPLATGSPRDEAGAMKPGAVLLASLLPLRNLEAVPALAKAQVTAFSTDLIPRITRAQAMDTLSSQASITGYKGALLAANQFPRFFPMFMTAAGTVFSAKVFVVGAAVAGLQAIATAKRLGATVTATDVRPEVKEQIESVGAKYIGVELKESASAGGGYAKELSEDDKLRQREMLTAHLTQVDVVITTALIGGVMAPRLITAEMVKGMKPGSIIVDLGADGGGNCELSQPGQTVVVGGVTIVAPLALPTTLPTHASLLFSRNLLNFIQTFTKDGAFQLDLSDEIQKGSLVAHQGQVVHPRVADALKAKGAA